MLRHIRRLRTSSSNEREEAAEELACRLDIPFTLVGILFVLVVLAEGLTPRTSGLKTVFEVASWVIWATLALEFALRLIIAPSAGRFLQRNWWQLVFLVIPFLRFLRAFGRGARLARLASSSVRATRTAAAKLSSRIAWLAALTMTVVLAASQLLYEYGPRTTYPQALHDTAIATVGGEPIGRDGAVAQTLEVVLIIYSVVVFAALAGALGAYFLERSPQGHNRGVEQLSQQQQDQIAPGPPITDRRRRTTSAR